MNSVKTRKQVNYIANENLRQKKETPFTVSIALHVK